MIPLLEALTLSLWMMRSVPSPPAIWLSGSRCCLSSNNCRTLTWLMGTSCRAVPVVEQLMNAGAIFAGEQAIAELRVAEHLRQFPEDLQMQVGGALGYQQHENQVDRLAVRRLEGHRVGGFYECGSGLAQLGDAPVRNRHTLSQAGRAEFFAGKQAV